MSKVQIILNGVRIYEREQKAAANQGNETRRLEEFEPIIQITTFYQSSEAPILATSRSQQVVSSLSFVDALPNYAESVFSTSERGDKTEKDIASDFENFCIRATRNQQRHSLTLSSIYQSNANHCEDVLMQNQILIQDEEEPAVVAPQPAEVLVAPTNFTIKIKKKVTPQRFSVKDEKVPEKPFELPIQSLPH